LHRLLKFFARVRAPNKQGRYLVFNPAAVGRVVQHRPCQNATICVVGRSLFVENSFSVESVSFTKRQIRDAHAATV
jgi:hypothetical protein